MRFQEWKSIFPLHLEYAAKDEYVSYELYHRILIIKDMLCYLLQPPLRERLCPVRQRQGIFERMEAPKEKQSDSGIIQFPSSSKVRIGSLIVLGI